jgi:outer membrane protein assembly factor BamB
LGISRDSMQPLPDRRDGRRIVEHYHSQRERMMRRFLGFRGLTCILFMATLVGACVVQAPAADLFSVTFSDNRINRQDADTGAVLGSFVPPVPAQSAGGAGLAASNSTLFYSSIDDTNIYRLDPKTGSMLGSFARPVNSTGIDGLAYGASSFGDTLFAQDYGTDTIYLLNPTTGAILNSYTLSFDAIGGIDFDTSANQLWVSDQNGNIYATNPNTGSVISSFSTGSFQTGVGLVGGRLFTAPQNAGVISERDKLTGAVIHSFPAPGGGNVAALGGAAPEPSALALLVGLLAPAMLRRRRQSDLR